jgi:hypothetical protein
MERKDGIRLGPCGSSEGEVDGERFVASFVTGGAGSGSLSNEKG